jgi:proline iminopeptidase
VVTPRLLAVTAVVLGTVSWTGCRPVLVPHATLVPTTVERDLRLPSIAITVAGRTRRVHLQTFGDSVRGDTVRPVLLALHGSLSDHRMLLPLAALADRYRVVLWDQRGNGLSERVPRDEYTFDAVVEEIDRIADRFARGRPVTLVGHSFGAMYAALYMSRHPARVREAALLEPGGLNGAIMGATFRDVINVALLEREVARTSWQNEVLTATDHDALDLKALLVLANGRQTNYFCDPQRPPPADVWRPGGYVEYLRGTLMGNGFGRFRYDFAAGLDTVDRPVLLVGASCSALGPAFQRRWHGPLFRRATLATLTGVGHRMLTEDPGAVLRVLRDFLAEYRVAPH